MHSHSVTERDCPVRTHTRCVMLTRLGLHLLSESMIMTSWDENIVLSASMLITNFDLRWVRRPTDRPTGPASDVHIISSNETVMLTTPAERHAPHQPQMLFARSHQLQVTACTSAPIRRHSPAAKQSQNQIKPNLLISDRDTQPRV